MLQLLLRLGTFQLSDIFYNTVGGVQESGIEYISGTGLQPVNDDPVFTPIEVTAEGKIFLGVDFKPTAAFMKLDKLANGKSALGLTLKAEAGVEVKTMLAGV